MTEQEYDQMITDMTNIFYKESNRFHKLFTMLDIKVYPCFISEKPTCEIDKENYAIILHRPKKYSDITLKLSYQVGGCNVDTHKDLSRSNYTVMPVWNIYEDDINLTIWNDIPMETPDALTLMSYVTEFYVQEADLYIAEVNPKDKI
jgi:hypothetical protein